MLQTTLNATLSTADDLIAEELARLQALSPDVRRAEIEAARAHAMTAREERRPKYDGPSLGQTIEHEGRALTVLHGYTDFASIAVVHVLAADADGVLHVRPALPISRVLLDGQPLPGPGVINTKVHGTDGLWVQCVLRGTAALVAFGEVVAALVIGSHGIVELTNGDDPPIRVRWDEQLHVARIGGMPDVRPATLGFVPAESAAPRVRAQPADVSSNP